MVFIIKTKKAQAAMEFLMTYGWVILIILIALGLLFYLGVFSPKSTNNCQLQAPFVCQDVKVTDSSVSFAVQGSGISSGTVQSIIVKSSSGDLPCNIPPGSEIIPTDTPTTVTCNLNPGQLSSLDNVKAEITISYTQGDSTIQHQIVGTASANVEKTTTTTSTSTSTTTTTTSTTTTTIPATTTTSTTTSTTTTTIPTTTSTSTTTTTLAPTGVWQTCSTDLVTQTTTSAYCFGYKFTPTTNIIVSQLCGRWASSVTKNVFLQSSTFSVLATTSITSTDPNSWFCNSVTPVTLTSGNIYYICGYHTTSYSFQGTVPKSCAGGKVTVNNGCYQSGSGASSGFTAPTCISSVVYGLVDMKFQ